MEHLALVDPSGVTTGCSCGWKSETLRSDKQTWHQWTEHRLAQ